VDPGDWAELPFPETWYLLGPVWPLEDRPTEMQNPLAVGRINLQAGLEMKKHYEEQQAKQGRGDAVFGKDGKLPVKNFPTAEDDCNELLHDARWERMPVLELKEYWKKIPTKRAHIYRRLPLEHHGAAGAVSECVIVRAHDRSLPLKLSMFHKANSTKKSLGSSESRDAADSWESPKAILDIQEALANMGAVFFCLWHMDPTPNILQRLLTYYTCGASDDRTEKEQCNLITEVIDDILRSNASRAISKEPPLTFRECRERWKDAAERKPAHSANRNRRDADRPGGAGRDSRGKPDGKSANKTGGRGGQQSRSRVLKHNGNLVCFQYNRASGCNRPRKTGGCDDGKGGIFAHVCNFEDRNGKPCLQQHCCENWRH